MKVKGIVYLTVITLLTGACSKDEETCEGSTYECSKFDGDSIPQVGSALKLYADTSTYSGTVKSGTNVTWDYSLAEIQDSIELDFVDPTTTSSGTEFPMSNLAVDVGAEVVYLKSGSEGVEVLGIEVDVQGTKIASAFDETYNLFEFPLRNGDKITDGFLLEDTKYNLTVNYLGSPVSADSVEIKRVGSVLTHVQGCGKVKTPYGEYDVLKVYKEETIADTITAYVFFGFGTIPLQVVEEASVNRSVEFLTDSLPYPAVTVYLDENMETTEVVFLKED